MRQGKIKMHAITKGHYPGKLMDSCELPGLISLGFWDCHGAPDWGLEAHRNEGLEIVFLETGGMGFTVDGKNHDLKAGNLTLTRPWQLHQLGNPNIGRGRLYWMIFDVGVRVQNQEWEWPSWVILTPADLADLTQKLRYSNHAVWTASSRARQIFHDLADCVVQWEEPRTGSRLAVTVNRLLVELLDMVSALPLAEPPALASRRRTVELFLKDLATHPTISMEPWTVETMADHCDMGITSLAKYCRALVNNGPMAYLNQCRLEHAATALRETPDLSVTEIAMKAGFNSSQYFSTLFRRQYKTTPSEYRSGSTA